LLTQKQRRPPLVNGIPVSKTMFSKLATWILLLFSLCWACGKEEGKPTPHDSAQVRSDPYWFLNESGLDPAVYNECWKELPVKYFELSQEGMGQIEEPAYFSRLSIDGSAAYRGIKDVERMGDFVSKVRLWDYGRLCALAEELGIYEMEKGYNSGTTHQDYIRLKVVMMDGREFSISDYGNQAPVQYWAFCASFEKVIENLAWDAR
jgi:hypothetical protein